MEDWGQLQYQLAHLEFFAQEVLHSLKKFHVVLGDLGWHEVTLPPHPET